MDVGRLGPPLFANQMRQNDAKTPDPESQLGASPGGRKEESLKLMCLAPVAVLDGDQTLHSLSLDTHDRCEQGLNRAEKSDLPSSHHNAQFAIDFRDRNALDLIGASQESLPQVFFSCTQNAPSANERHLRACEYLFTSNEPPLDAQLAEIQESVRVARALKVTLDKEIAETRTKPPRLERAALDASRHIELCKYPLAPVRCIPPEILSRIFICYGDLVNDTSRRDFGPMAQEFLVRAGNHALNIVFHCSGSPHRQFRCKVVLQALLSRSHRWEVAQFRITSELYPCMALIKNNLPILRKLTLDINGFRTSITNLETFGSCPRLVDLTLKLVPAYSAWPVGYIHFPWHQLSCYSGARRHGTTDILAVAPRIMQWTLSRGTPGLAPVVLVHRMCSLTLTRQYTGDSLEHLVLPSLEHLGFDFEFNPLVTMIQLLRRSAPPLSSIALDRMDEFSEARNNGSADLLQAAPTVTRLEMTIDPTRPQVWASRFFSRLAHSSDSTHPPLLSALKHLTMSAIPHYESFFSMVESRCVPGFSGDRLEFLTVLNVRTEDASKNRIQITFRTSPLRIGTVMFAMFECGRIVVVTRVTVTVTIRKNTPLVNYPQFPDCLGDSPNLG
ncbi:hypothetical protein FB451DRAFT_1486267 [Mycena latifolia]|nr:hypothetical protein FB451DRAFT_1486267 [Mycena latifolia]